MVPKHNWFNSIVIDFLSSKSYWKLKVCYFSQFWHLIQLYWKHFALSLSSHLVCKEPENYLCEELKKLLPPMTFLTTVQIYGGMVPLQLQYFMGRNLALSSGKNLRNITLAQRMN